MNLTLFFILSKRVPLFLLERTPPLLLSSILPPRYANSLFLSFVLPLFRLSLLIHILLLYDVCFHSRRVPLPSTLPFLFKSLLPMYWISISLPLLRLKRMPTSTTIPHLPPTRICQSFWVLALVAPR